MTNKKHLNNVIAAALAVASVGAVAIEAKADSNTKAKQVSGANQNLNWNGFIGADDFWAEYQENGYQRELDQLSIGWWKIWGPITPIQPGRG